jgi:hypothetical protein
MDLEARLAAMEARLTALEAKQKKSRTAKQDDHAWFESLKQNPAYQGLDIDRELAKCHTWCETNLKLWSRKRFVNWLNRAERPLVLKTHSVFLHGVQAFLDRGKRHDHHEQGTIFDGVDPTHGTAVGPVLPRK